MDFVHILCISVLLLTVLVFFPANVKIEIENSMRNYICLQIWYPGGIESRETVSLMSSFAKESVPVLFYRAKNRDLASAGVQSIVLSTPILGKKHCFPAIPSAGGI